MIESCEEFVCVGSKEHCLMEGVCLLRVWAVAFVGANFFCSNKASWSLARSFAYFCILFAWLLWLRPCTYSQGESQEPHMPPLISEVFYGFLKILAVLIYFNGKVIFTCFMFKSGSREIIKRGEHFPCM